MTEPVFFEDVAVGDRRTTGTVAVTAESVIAFGRAYDPQPFHTDAEAAVGSFFGELVASGWQTTALTMRLLVEGAVLGGTPLIGAGVEEIRWPRPTRPGDILTAETEILELLPAGRRPDIGMIRVRTTTKRQDGDVVQTMITRMVLPRRLPAAE